MSTPIPVTTAEFLVSEGKWCPGHRHVWSVEKRVGGVRSFDLMLCDGSGVIECIAYDMERPIYAGQIVLGPS